MKEIYVFTSSNINYNGELRQTLQDKKNDYRILIDPFQINRFDTTPLQFVNKEALQSNDVIQYPDYEYKLENVSFDENTHKSFDN